MSFQIIQFLNVFFYAESDTKSDTQLCLLKKSLLLESSCPHFSGSKLGRLIADHVNKLRQS